MKSLKLHSRLKFWITRVFGNPETYLLLSRKWALVAKTRTTSLSVLLPVACAANCLCPAIMSQHQYNGLDSRLIWCRLAPRVVFIVYAKSQTLWMPPKKCGYAEEGRLCNYTHIGKHTFGWAEGLSCRSNRAYRIIHSGSGVDRWTIDYSLLNFRLLIICNGS
jgi:hypothetical protein